MWLFNRHKNVDPDILPEEVKEYYASERRDRVGLVWVLAFGSLLLTVAVALGLFFGGRWAYRKIANEPASTTTTQQPAAPTPATPATPEPATPTPSPTTTPATPAPSPASGGTVDSSAATTTPAPTQTTANPQTTPPAATSTSSSPASTTTNLTNTGPGDTLLFFIATVGAATITHFVHTRRRSSI